MGDRSDRMASWVQRRVEDDISAEPHPPPSPAPLSAVDQRPAQLVEDRLRVHGNTTASVSQEWSATAGMWFVEINPVETKAAFVSVAFDSRDLLSIVIGRTSFEMFPLDDDALQELSGLLDAVFAGQVVEQGAARRHCRHDRYREFPDPSRVLASEVTPGTPLPRLRERRTCCCRRYPDLKRHASQADRLVRSARVDRRSR